MTYEIFCLALFISTTIIPFVLLSYLVPTGINYLIDRKKVKDEK